MVSQGSSPHQPVLFRPNISFNKTWRPIHWNNRFSPRYTAPPCICVLSKGFTASSSFSWSLYKLYILLILSPCFVCFYAVPTLCTVFWLMLYISLTLSSLIFLVLCCILCFNSGCNLYLSLCRHRFSPLYALISFFYVHFCSFSFILNLHPVPNNKLSLFKMSKKRAKRCLRSNLCLLYFFEKWKVLFRRLKRVMKIYIKTCTRCLLLHLRF